MGRSIIMTGYAAAETTAVLIERERTALLKRYDDAFIDRAREWCGTDISEHIKAAEAVPDTVVFPLGDTGVFGGLWEFAESLKQGFTVILDDIPIKQHTVEFCDLMEINLYSAPSKGSMLAATYDPVGLIDECNKRGVNAVLIGHFTDGNRRIFITTDDTERYAEKPDDTEKLKLSEYERVNQ
ncbi:MAG: hypothetical protein IJM62_01570 [Lachnospiraceae bacterium]|nr:hypothetical protein [Lachnospiraceae bacterium]